MDASVEALAESFIPVRVDSDDREDLVRLWDVRELPNFVLFSPDGGILDRIVEIVRQPSEITGHMEKALAALDRYRKAKDQARKQLGSVKRQKQLADQHVLLQMWDAAADQLHHVLKLDPRDAHKGQEETIVSLVYVELMRGRFETAVAHADHFSSQWPDGKSRAKVLYWRGLALHRMSRTDEAIAQWEKVIEAFPEDATGKLAREAITRAKQGR